MMMIVMLHILAKATTVTAVKIKQDFAPKIHSSNKYTFAGFKVTWTKVAISPSMTLCY